MAPDGVVVLDGVNAFRGPAHVLRGVSLEVRQGETVCLVGRNGAGKTTTMSSIMGTVPVRGGTITFQGEDITRLSPHLRARRGIGFAPDDCGIFPELTVAENLRIGAWMAAAAHRGEDGPGSSEHESTYELFPELRRLLERKGQHLSGGEKKMVAIARSMALRPSILLLDEAFEGLAPVVVSRFADAVQKIKAMGISLLIAESNVATAGRVADRLYVIDRGEIIFQGTAEEAFATEDVMRTLRG